jgi:hypothetical protein
MIRRSVLLLAFLLLLAPALRGEHNRSSVQGRHFFQPSRTLFFFRPDLYVRLHSAPPPIVYSPVMHSQQTAPHGNRIYRVVMPGFAPSEVVRANTSDLIFQVTPAHALVYIDGRLIGSGGDFSHEKSRYPIVDGLHVLRIEFPGYRTFETRMEVVANRTLNLTVELEKTDR